mmetsp:Transcript_118508/g.335197  ORF Transcript_118508/g.335197 Transcript_118508/m.335197 type:complete len:1297 (+) Transcript_118508:106-3996(+)
MSPACGDGAPPSLKVPGSSGGVGRALGLRESNQALAELKTKLEFALSRLNDQDTQRTGVEEIREFLQTLYPDWFPVVIGCIGEAGTNLKPLGRCESVKLLGLLAELHGDVVVPLLPRILQVVVTRLQDADLHLREACAETVFRLARALVVEVESSQAFATLLKSLFGALGEHSKWVQIGAADCICSVIQGSPPSVIRENLGRLCSRLVQHLGLPLAMARPQLLNACVYAMQAVSGAEFDEALPALMPCLESCLGVSSDWQTRKQAIEVLQWVGDNPELGQSLELPPPGNPSVRPTPLQRRIASMLEVVKTDKVRAVREAVKDVMLRWSIAKTAPSAFSAAARSSSPVGGSAAWSNDREREQAPVSRAQASTATMRSSSPPSTGLPWQQSQLEREQASTRAALEKETPGSAGCRQSRSVRAATRERDRDTGSGGIGGSADDFSVAVLVPDRPRVNGLTAEAGDAAAEKAARRTAVKEALSGAVLKSTQKPRPKRERQSIFNGPANAQFFKSAYTPGPSPSAAEGGADGGADVDFEEGHLEMHYSEEPGVDEDFAEEQLYLAALSAEESPSEPLQAPKTRGGGGNRTLKPHRSTVAKQNGGLSGGRPDGAASEFHSHGQDGYESTVAQASQPDVVPEEFEDSAAPEDSDERDSHGAEAASNSSGGGVSSWPPGAGDGTAMGGSTLAFEEHRRQPAMGTEQAELPLTYSDDELDDAEQHVDASSGADPPDSGRLAGTARSHAASSRRTPTGAEGRQACETRIREAMWPSINVASPTQQTDADHISVGVALAAEAVAASDGDGERPSDAELVSARKAPAAHNSRDNAAARATAMGRGPRSQRDVGNGNGSEDHVLAHVERLSVRLRASEEALAMAEERLASRLRGTELTCESQSELVSAQRKQIEAQDRQLQLQEQQLRAQEQRLQRQELRLQRQEEKLRQQELLLGHQDQQFEQHDQQLKEHEQHMEQQDKQIALLNEVLAAARTDDGTNGAGQPMRRAASEHTADGELVGPSDSSGTDVIGTNLASSNGGGGGDAQESLRAPSFEHGSRAAAQAAGSRPGAAVANGGRPALKGWVDGVADGLDGQAPVAGARIPPPPLLAEALAVPPHLGGGGLHSGAGGSATGTGSFGERPVHGVVPLRGETISAPPVASWGREAAGIAQRRSVGAVWEKVLELCESQKYLEAYKQVIAEPEECCLLRLMQHTGPIVERLDAESNSRLIRRLIHILSSPSKEPAVTSIEQIFSWLWQALDAGIHFTASQVEDLAAALQRAAAPLSPLPAPERAEASRLLNRVSALRR